MHTVVREKSGSKINLYEYDNGDISSQHKINLIFLVLTLVTDAENKMQYLRVF